MGRDLFNMHQIIIRFIPQGTVDSQTVYQIQVLTIADNQTFDFTIFVWKCTVHGNELR